MFDSQNCCQCHRIFGLPWPMLAVRLNRMRISSFYRNGIESIIMMQTHLPQHRSSGVATFTRLLFPTCQRAPGVYSSLLWSSSFLSHSFDLRLGTRARTIRKNDVPPHRNPGQVSECMSEHSCEKTRQNRIYARLVAGTSYMIIYV